MSLQTDTISGQTCIAMVLKTKIYLDFKFMNGKTIPSRSMEGFPLHRGNSTMVKINPDRENTEFKNLMIAGQKQGDKRKKKWLNFLFEFVFISYIHS